MLLHRCLNTTSRRLNKSYSLLIRSAPQIPAASVKVCASLRQSTHASAMSDAQIRSRLKELLPTLDLNKATVRDIRSMLAKEFPNIEDKKKVVKEEVEVFLLERTEVEEDTDNGAGEEEEEEDLERQPPSKKRRGNDSVQLKPNDGGPCWQLGNNKFVAITTFKGNTYVNIREYYEKDGGLLPTKKGVALTPDVWVQVKASLPNMLTACEKGDEDYVVELPGNKRIYYSEFRGKGSIHIREMYDKGTGEMQPGAKGVTLTEEMIKQLLAAADELHMALGNPSGAPASGPSERKPAKTVPPQPLTGQGGGSTTLEERPGEVIDLGGNKRLTLSEFRGVGRVDLREYYMKDGQPAPTKKGVSLSPEDWSEVCRAVPKIMAAAETGVAKVVLDLSGRKKVSISSFKGKVYVGIREYYDKNGEELPGQKGCNLSLEQWKLLCENLDEFNRCHGLG